MKIGKVERRTVETVDLNLHDVRLSFADDATPADAGGPGALVIQAPGLSPHVVPASDPVVTAITSRIAALLEGDPAVTPARKPVKP